MGIKVFKDYLGFSKSQGSDHGMHQKHESNHELNQQDKINQ